MLVILCDSFYWWFFVDLLVFYCFVWWFVGLLLFLLLIALSLFDCWFVLFVCCLGNSVVVIMLDMCGLFRLCLVVCYGYLFVCVIVIWCLVVCCFVDELLVSLVWLVLWLFVIACCFRLYGSWSWVVLLVLSDWLGMLGMCVLLLVCLNCVDLMLTYLLLIVLLLCSFLRWVGLRLFGYLCWLKLG